VAELADAILARERDKIETWNIYVDQIANKLSYRFESCLNHNYKQLKTKKMSKKQQDKKEKQMLVPSKRVIDAILKASEELSGSGSNSLRETITVTGSGDSQITSMGIPLTGTINPLNYNSTALYPNSSTAISENVNASIGQPEPKVNPKDFNFTLNLDFGKKGGKLASQLKKQGYVLNKLWINDCETIRIDLLAMADIKILKKKEVRKAFERLTEQIGQAISIKYFDAKAVKVK
jgi:hypothetical protein